MGIRAITKRFKKLKNASKKPGIHLESHGWGIMRRMENEAG
jgi:hypothetical protein